MTATIPQLTRVTVFLEDATIIVSTATETRLETAMSVGRMRSSLGQLQPCVSAKSALTHPPVTTTVKHLDAMLPVTRALAELDPATVIRASRTQA
jgi:hypothetical protein